MMILQLSLSVIPSPYQISQIFHIFFFFKFQNENIWLKLRACYINGNIQMKNHQWNSDEVCIDIVKNDENIYMFTNIYGASFYFGLPYVFLSKLIWILYYLIKLHSLFSW